MLQLFTTFRDFMYEVLKFFQHLTQPVLGSQSYWFAIVMLTVAVRVVLIPLTVKQVRSMRAMQEVAPELKKLQAKYKNDKAKLNEEMMALYKEKGVNPFMGCLPLVAQLPFFWVLFRVIETPNLSGEQNILNSHAFFGIKLNSTWLALHGSARFLSATGLTILALIVAMSLTTYISQQQLMSRQTGQVNPQQQQLMKILPFMFLIFAIRFPLAVLIYWITTNVWSMGQQYLLLRNQPVAAGAGSATARVVEGSAKPTGPPKRAGLFMRALESAQQRSQARTPPAAAAPKKTEDQARPNGSRPAGDGVAKRKAASSEAARSKGSGNGQARKPGGGAKSNGNQPNRKPKPGGKGAPGAGQRRGKR